MVTAVSFLLDPRRHAMKERLDGLCPFCGTDVGDFPVCRGCRAEKFYSQVESLFRLWDFVFFGGLVSIFLYFRDAVHYYFGTFSQYIGGVLEPDLGFSIGGLVFIGLLGVYYIFLIFLCFGFLSNLYDLWRPVAFTGFGWKKR